MAGKGFLGGIGDKLAHELFENDDAPASAPAPTPVTAQPAPVQSGTMVYPFGTGSASVAPEVPDEKITAMVNGAVFTDLSGRRSRFMQFQKMYDTLGHPADIGMVLKALQVNDPTITPANVLADIDSHSALLEGVKTSAAADFQSAATERLGAADQAIAALKQQNEDAQKEIARHQQETGERIGQISQLQSQRADSESAIARAKAKTEAAAAAVSATLTTMRQLFATLPA